MAASLIKFFVGRAGVFLPLVAVLGINLYHQYQTNKLDAEIANLERDNAALKVKVSGQENIINGLRQNIAILQARIHARQQTNAVPDNGLIDFMRERGYISE